VQLIAYRLEVLNHILGPP